MAGSLRSLGLLVCLAWLGSGGGSLYAQAPTPATPGLPRPSPEAAGATPLPMAAAPEEPGQAPSRGLFHRFHHLKHVPACASCVAVPTTSKTTEYRYETKRNVICYTRERCSCLKCLFRFHGHHAECEPEVVPVVKRQLVKHKVTEEKQGTKYEGKLSPAPEPPDVVAPCRLHGPGCLGHR